MWAPWLRSPSRVRTTSKRTSPNFSCSSFKDIQSLCGEESNPQPASPKSLSIFRRVRISTSLLRAWVHRNAPQPCITFPGADQRIVLYFTSLRVVRKTFNDCRVVRSILRSFRVSIDERDVSMDAQFLDELQGIIGCTKLSLPIVFIGGRYVGGAEEIGRLHECGELNKLIAGLPVVDPGACDLCGGLRFILCDLCDGSHKVFVEKIGFRSCTVCNVNGLIRCSCSFVLHRSLTK
ncbi:hypothetical protein I3843_01G292100 [Carya illinoinensis]|uniref:Glutaredoxin domain-containing protein n=1 Tax=Carya illinoinensis TaxID=32201 RepID=A0A8T1RU28_CARIL|nr:uncharacterized protein At5g39865-like [Carya illinoinensis]KAG2730541.1 hypothetical protein I3760_01G298200 [Carya illinoinensis]KAG6670286.1 hypothetical protein CIPAW_01G300900 [Carya illinoinensis]KAG6735081.1 hypothetical protein I3842_01G303000 [Carya illinoinensis]KAG7999141.1 hypothetical protein I3843_01G292100 [Carya illinoinensis]